MVGVATAKSPCGPYTYKSSFKPLGADSRDEGLFQDGESFVLFHASAAETIIPTQMIVSRAKRNVIFPQLLDYRRQVLSRHTSCMPRITIRTSRSRSWIQTTTTCLLKSVYSTVRQLLPN